MSEEAFDGVSVRTAGALRRGSGIRCIADASVLTDEELLRIRNFGVKALREVRRVAPFDIDAAFRRLLAEHAERISAAGRGLIWAATYGCEAPEDRVPVRVFWRGNDQRVQFVGKTDL